MKSGNHGHASTLRSLNTLQTKAQVRRHCVSGSTNLEKESNASKGKEEIGVSPKEKRRDGPSASLNFIKQKAKKRKFCWGQGWFRSVKAIFAGKTKRHPLSFHPYNRAKPDPKEGGKT